MNKVCAKCGIKKPLSAFGKDRKYGYKFHCRECVSLYTKQHYQENKEQVKATSKKYQLLHPEQKKIWISDNRLRVNESRKRSYQRHIERYLAYNKAYHKNNIDEIKKRRVKDHDELREPYLKNLARKRGMAKELIEANPQILELIKVNLTLKRLCKTSQ